MKRNIGIEMLAASSLLVASCGGSDEGRASGGNEDGIGVGTAEDGGPGGGTADGSGGSADGTFDDDGGGGGPLPKFDVGAPGGMASCDGGPGMGGGLQSYIWIANTGDSPPTVSKINTVTLVEEGRYPTRADGAGNPSRTSVALSGHAAVANRAGGITKYYAYDCPPGPTSTGGPDSELPWGMDACVAWSTDFAYATQRPVAWTPGVLNQTTCEWENELIWSSGANGGNTLEVFRLDGETGVLLDVVPIPEISAGTYGAYGGAVDGDGNFWISQLGSDGNALVRTDAVTLSYQIYNHTIAGYGMQVDHAGRPWICGYDGQVARFNPATATFDYANTGAAMYGCMPDNAHMWIGGNQGHVRGVNLETMAVEYDIALPMIDSNDIHGTSIDFDGKIWGVSRGTLAARIDPATGQVDYVAGLNSPYTYSDMTGYALSNVGNPPG